MRAVQFISQAAGRLRLQWGDYPMRLSAYAKINLVLAVGGLRPDGYHEVETVLQQLELHDRLELRQAEQFTLYTDSAEVPHGPGNLVWEAAVLLRERFRCPFGADIRLYKSIPVAAGLGGGSADAAATLVGLNELWNLNLDLETLLGLAAELGSDVPFFLVGPTALARGRGEILAPLPPAPEMGVVLVTPAFGVRAAEAYAHFDRLPGGAPPDLTPVLRALTEKDRYAVAQGLFNGLEAAVFDLYPEVRALKKELGKEEGVLGALVSGSGPTVFGLTADVEQAEVVAARLRSRGLPARATKTRGPSS